MGWVVGAALWLLGMPMTHEALGGVEGEDWALIIGWPAVALVRIALAIMEAFT